MSKLCPLAFLSTLLPKEDVQAWCQLVLAFVALLEVVKSTRAAYKRRHASNSTRRRRPRPKSDNP